MPLVVRAVPDQDVEAAVLLRCDRAPHDQVLVGEPAGVPGVLYLLYQRTGDQVQPVHVVQLRIVGVDADQHLGGLALAGGEDLRVDVLERREVTPLHRLDVNVVQPPVLVPARVPHVQDMPSVPRPREVPDAPVVVFGQRPCRRPVHAPGAERREPHVQHAVAGGDPRQLSPVGGDTRAGPFRVAEQDAARDEIDHAP
jgi:hypothetical protein